MDYNISVHQDKVWRALDGSEWFDFTLTINNALYGARAVRVSNGSASMYHMYRCGASRQTSKHSAMYAAALDILPHLPRTARWGIPETHDPGSCFNSDCTACRSKR
jgi:hypothetical protein